MLTPLELEANVAGTSGIASSIWLDGHLA